MDSGSKRAIEDRVYSGERLTRQDGLDLYAVDDLAWLGRLAHHRRTVLHDDRVTFADDRSADGSIDVRQIAYGRAEDPASHLVDAVLSLREISGASDDKGQRSDSTVRAVRLVREDGAPAEALRTFAVTRLLLNDAVPHLCADWASHGPSLAQLVLNFGADDLIGTDVADDEARADLLELITDASFRPVGRDSGFAVVRQYDPPVPLAQRRSEPQKVWA